MPFSSEKKDEVIIRIEDTEIENSEYEKILGIKVDAKRIFHEIDIDNKASQKVNVFSRLMPHMSYLIKRKW